MTPVRGAVHGASQKANKSWVCFKVTIVAGTYERPKRQRSQRILLQKERFWYGGHCSCDFCCLQVNFRHNKFCSFRNLLRTYDVRKAKERSSVPKSEESIVEHAWFKRNMVGTIRTQTDQGWKDLSNIFQELGPWISEVSIEQIQK